MRGCGDVGMWGCGDVGMWGCGDVAFWRAARGMRTCHLETVVTHLPPPSPPPPCPPPPPSPPPPLLGLWPGLAAKTAARKPSSSRLAWLSSARH
eukprot:6326875-Prymnesium_polylepis.1